MIPKAESLHTEFKPSFSDEAIISLLAFSNSKGGVVYIGISDNAEVKGVNVGKETLQNWINEVKIKTTPQLIPDAELIIIEDKKLLK
jgi:ATP-dependent DNA helicase RecG